MPEERTIRLRNEKAEMARVTAELDELAASAALPAKVVFALQVALDEVLNNIISYGYLEDDDPVLEHRIEVTLRADEAGVEALIVDDARPFDLLAAPEPDTAQPLAERAIGGLGNYLVKQLMDEVRYERVGDRNRLTLRRRFEPAPAPAVEPLAPPADTPPPAATPEGPAAAAAPADAGSETADPTPADPTTEESTDGDS